MVLIEKDWTAFFFKRCHGSAHSTRDLETYTKTHAAGLDSQANTCHMFGLVMDNNTSNLGLR